MRVCLFEDAGAAGLEPLSLTRPVFALRSGCSTLGERVFRRLGATDRFALVRDYLADVTAEDHPDVRVNDVAGLRPPTLYVNARWLPPDPGSALPRVEDGPHVATIDGEVAWMVLPSLIDADVEECLARALRELPRINATGRLVRHLWELIDANADLIGLDLWYSAPERVRRISGLPHVVGPADRVWIGKTAQLDPLVVLDTTKGPVVIEDDAVVSAFTRIEGPAYVGAGTHLMGAKVRAGTTLGPQCRVGGEVEASVVQGYSNKYHDGFLGHAFVGEWVNLGAGTTNSDLRNDYGPVTVTVAGRRIDTGRSKVGCFVGDHAKSGLGCLINTGANVGAFAGLLPTGGLLPKWVPSFATVWNGEVREGDDVGAMLKTAEKVMSRRGVPLTPARAAMYRETRAMTAADRAEATGRGRRRAA